MFLAAAFIFSSFYLVTTRILFKQVDSELLTHATKLSQIVTRQGVSLHEVLLQQQLFTEFSNIPGMVVALLDENGIAVSSSLSMDRPYVSYNYLFQLARGSAKPVYLNQEISNVPMRFIAQPIRSGSDLVGIVLVAHPIDAIQKSLNTLLTTLAILLGLLVIPTVLGGLVLAGKIMQPISHITNKIDKISSEHLEERVDTSRTGDEMEKLGVTFNSLLDRLQDSFQRERQFIGDVAHELKTPVATLKSGIELALLKNRTNDEYRQFFKETLIDVNRLSTTIKNILDLAWLGAESSQISENSFNLSVTLTELSEIATKLAAQKRISIRNNIRQNIFVIGVEDKITRAILNIIDNAIKYTPVDKTVSITLHKRGGSAILEITDTGIGISEKEIDHIFERFYRGAKTAKTLGSGLGLAIAQGIIKAHRGEIDVTSKVGKGTTVSITLPIKGILS
jgi:signal transduction histidine kinase